MVPERQSPYFGSMFYRRKIILALLQSFGEPVPKISLQKLLLLFTKQQTKPDYEFVPYKYGCYSFSASADLSAMVRRGFLLDADASLTKIGDTDYINQLKPADLKILRQVKSAYGEMSSDELMKHTYLTFPFYAIRSEVAQRILTKEEQDIVSRSKPASNENVLFTIGYEGISLEEYLVRLLKNDVRVLVDVRRNPVSMKYGFSKSQLTKTCASMDIQYIHIPEVGIQSDQRQELNTQSDYDALFAQYRSVNLKKTAHSQQEILRLLQNHKRIALTCFEANSCQCHRKHLAEAIEHLPGFEYEVRHI